MTLYHDVPTELSATSADFTLLEAAFKFTLSCGLPQIYGRMARTDNNGNISGACVVGAITESYRGKDDQKTLWTDDRGTYSTSGDGLPAAVQKAYKLSSPNLLVDLRQLDAATQAELDAATGDAVCSQPVVNITSLNDLGVRIPLLVRVLRQGLRRN